MGSAPQVVWADGRCGRAKARTRTSGDALKDDSNLRCAVVTDVRRKVMRRARCVHSGGQQRSDFRRGRGQGGGCTLSAVLLLPLVLVLCTMGLQAALWNHATASSRTIVRQELLRAAHGAIPVDELGDVLIRRLEQQTDMSAIHVDIRVGDGVVSGGDTSSALLGNVTVDVSGSVAGLIPLTRAPVRVVEAAPLEGWRPWP